VVSLGVMQKYLVALGVMACLFIVPMSVGAADLVPECGGNGQPACQACYVVELVNNVVGWLVLILGTIAAILIVVAGARLVTSGGNSAAKEAAKSSMTNLIIGYIIVLSAWLVMDYGLRALLVEGGSARFGVWNQISCVDQPVSDWIDVVQREVVYIPLEMGSNWVPYASTPGGGTGAAPGSKSAACTLLPGPPGVTEYDCAAQQTQCRAEQGTPRINAAGSAVICDPRVVTGGGGTGGNLPQCTNSFCSVSRLMAGGMTSSQANVMSCIAMTESTGNPNARASGSTACGLFQITAPTWSDFNPGGSCSSHSSCTNVTCNIATAVRIVRSVGYSRWTCPNCNAKAIQCIQRYGG
jgi:Type IV secretion system pilin/Transglycosylase SLT domain